MPSFAQKAPPLPDEGLGDDGSPFWDLSESGSVREGSGASPLAGMPSVFDVSAASAESPAVLPQRAEENWASTSAIPLETSFASSGAHSTQQQRSSSPAAIAVATSAAAISCPVAGTAAVVVPGAGSATTGDGTDPAAQEVEHRREVLAACGVFWLRLSRHLDPSDKSLQATGFARWKRVSSEINAAQLLGARLRCFAAQLNLARLRHLHRKRPRSRGAPCEGSSPAPGQRGVALASPAQRWQADMLRRVGASSNGATSRSVASPQPRRPQPQPHQQPHRGQGQSDAAADREPKRGAPPRPASVPRLELSPAQEKPCITDGDHMLLTMMGQNQRSNPRDHADAWQPIRAIHRQLDSRRRPASGSASLRAARPGSALHAHQRLSRPARVAPGGTTEAPAVPAADEMEPEPEHELQERQQQPQQRRPSSAALARSRTGRASRPGSAPGWGAQRARRDSSPAAKAPQQTASRPTRPESAQPGATKTRRPGSAAPQAAERPLQQRPWAQNKAPAGAAEQLLATLGASCKLQYPGMSPAAFGNRPRSAIRPRCVVAAPMLKGGLR